MIISICGLLLLLVSLLALALQRFYSSVPAKELKRLASRGDHLAAALYQPVAYGASMRLLLWIVFGLGFSFGTLCVASGLTGVLAYIVIALAVATVVALQSIRLTVHTARVAVHAAPALKWLLSYLHTPLHMMVTLIARVRTHTAHSGLYEKEDLVALIAQQKDQVDNRIAHRELDIIERAVQFDDRHAADVLLPMSQVHMVRLDDHIGPVLLGELHDSGQTSFLVYESTPEHVVGTLYLRDAVQAREGGRVADLLHAKVIFVHEDFSLREVLQAFVHTSQFMVVVINSFEEAVGIVTLEHLLAELLGDAPEGDPLAYEDRAAIAAFRPPIMAEEPVLAEDQPDAQPDEAAAASEQQSEAESSPDTTEVVE